ncbi:hypothetical protein MTO96_007188 [Rhipicephalus appendiculatus]
MATLLGRARTARRRRLFGCGEIGARRVFWKGEGPPSKFRIEGARAGGSRKARRHVPAAGPSSSVIGTQRCSGRGGKERGVSGPSLSLFLEARAPPPQCGAGCATLSSRVAFRGQSGCIYRFSSPDPILEPFFPKKVGRSSLLEACPVFETL